MWCYCNESRKLDLRIKEDAHQDLVVFPFEEKLHATLDVKVGIIDLSLQVLRSNKLKLIQPTGFISNPAFRHEIKCPINICCFTCMYSA